jgi:hypothetical protein
MSNVFTPDEVASLDAFQRKANLHSYTCPNRGDGNHRFVGNDLGMLYPTVRGWICAFCDYTQDHAHSYMKMFPTSSK